MQKRKTQTFNDGILSLYSVTDNDGLALIQSGIRFGTRTVGSKRFFEAYEFQRKADKLVRIPQTKEPHADDVVIIEGAQYNILQVQDIKDTMPKCWQLTLEAIREGRYHVID